MSTYFETRPNWARKIREMILFSVLCTVYCGRGCVSLESERGKELAQSLKKNNERLREFLLRTTGQQTGRKPEVFLEVYFSPGDTWLFVDI